MKDFFSIGIDFGTLSARAVLVNIRTGKEKFTSIYGYQDAVIDRFLPHSGEELPGDFALQNPSDYISAVKALLKDIANNSVVDPSAIISIGIDFTACTILPVNEKMMPLCMDAAYRDNPHSWVKLWKHHGAQAEADTINRMARERKEEFLSYYGDSSSSEWFFAKVMEVYNKAPDIYAAAHLFVEAGDWIVWALTGVMMTSTCMAGFKAFWNEKDGYPSKHFFASICPGLENITDKAIWDVRPVGTRAGGLTKEMAAITGLLEGTSVAVSIIDAHAATPVVGVVDEGSLIMAMGTSLCHILVSKKKVDIKGISGVVKDGVIPGYYGYEAGQAAVGDIYDWFIQTLAPTDCFDEAAEYNISPFAVMDKRAAKVKPGESGLLALDWWNGNRSMLNNANLSGMLIGMTLATQPEEIYRALIESTAYGTRNIIESIEEHGIPIKRIFACGGLSRKSELVMQIFADILSREISVTDVAQTTAYGAAMYGMVAAGCKRGGYDTLEDAMRALSRAPHKTYKPNPENKEIYTWMFHEYQRLSLIFGDSNRDIMYDLKNLKGLRTKKLGDAIENTGGGVVSREEMDAQVLPQQKVAAGK